jgi:hypothetical protein
MSESSIRKALEIATLPLKDFRSRMASGEFDARQVHDAQLLRAELAAKANGVAKARRPSLGQRLLASGDYVTVSKKEEDHVEEVQISKEERGRRWKAAFDEAVDAYVDRHKCSRAVAVEKVSFSQTMREQHTLERFEKGLVLDSDLAKSGSVIDPSPMGPRMQNSPTVGGGIQNPVRAATTFNDAPRVRAQTQFNTPGDSNEVIDAATLLQQRAAALRDRNPGLSMTAALNAALAQPDVKKALSDERASRLDRASRIYGTAGGG